MILADLFTKAGAPPGLLNVIHGQHAAVDFICEHPDIRAVSFVGSDQAVRPLRSLCIHIHFQKCALNANYRVEQVDDW